VRRADKLTVLIVLKFGSLNILEPSGPVKACNGIALPFSYIHLVQRLRISGAILLLPLHAFKNCVRKIFIFILMFSAQAPEEETLRPSLTL
jgi:hypothetical protein